jgi:hypothetical protein
MDGKDIAGDNTGALTGAVIHWFITLSLTIWCLFWLALNGGNYIYLTWHLFSTLKWLSFLLLISPCFWVWLGIFSSSVWIPLNLLWVTWGKLDEDLSRTQVVLLVLVVPVLLGLALQFIGPYFYPVILGGDSGTNVLMRMIPILGGKGYN